MSERSPEPVIVATGFGDGDTGGGIFVVGADGCRRLDWIASAGLSLAPGGHRLARLLHDAGRPDSAAELVISDQRGAELYRRLDAVSDAHGIAWHDDGLVAVSTATNELVWLTDSGDVRRSWRAAGSGDAWHLNSLVVDDGRLFACAFGRFADHRGWAGGAADGQGIVFDVETGETVMSGLSCPHDPVRLGDHWGVCDSKSQAFLVMDGDAVVERVDLGAWTRGVAVTDDAIYVGLSAHRAQGMVGTGSVAVLDRATLSERRRITLPCREVYAVAALPPNLLRGLERGFQTNVLRVSETHQAEMLADAGLQVERLWASSEPLAPESCRVEIATELPELVAAGGSCVVDWTVTNLGPVVLGSVDPNPVCVACRWFSEDGAELVLDGARAALPRHLPPGGIASGTLRLTAPQAAGVMELRLSLVQEFVRWFDDVDPRNGTRQRVVVTPAPSVLAR